MDLKDSEKRKRAGKEMTARWSATPRHEVRKLMMNSLFVCLF